MSLSADANITGTFLHFWTHKVHYKLRQSTLQNFDDGGLLSGWSFVRTPLGPCRNAEQGLMSRGK